MLQCQWKIDGETLRRFNDDPHVRVITPGAHAGEMLHVLSSLEHPSATWQTDDELARGSLTTTLSHPRRSYRSAGAFRSMSVRGSQRAMTARRPRSS